MAKNKISLKDRLYDFDQDMFHTILNQLIASHPELEQEIELIIDPDSVSNPIAFYKKMVTAEIKTHNYGTFPNRGIDGLNKCELKFQNLKSNRIYLEAWKLASAILFVIFRCEYSTKNEIELEELEMKVMTEISAQEFQIADLDKIKISWFKSMLINRYKTKSRQNKFINKFQSDRDRELIRFVIGNLITK